MMASTAGYIMHYVFMLTATAEYKMKVLACQHTEQWCETET